MKTLLQIIMFFTILSVLNGCGSGGGASGGDDDSSDDPGITNNAPALEVIANQNVNVTEAMIQVNAADTSGGDTDADGNTITYTCVYDATVDADVNPGSSCTDLSGLSFNTGTGVMDWTPVSGTHGGTYEFKITGSDGSLSDSEIFVLSVYRCPVNYALVYGGGIMGTSDFCVSKYEMKLNKGSGIVSDGNDPDTGWNAAWDAVSSPEGKPWGNINQVESIASCNNMDDGTFDYHLITNDEWQTVAHSIENESSNWTDGKLNRGHSDSSPSATLAADVDGVPDDDPYVGTGNNSGQAYGSGGEQKRAHTLSNGEIIWDLSGNSYEWVDFDGLGGTINYFNDVIHSWIELNDPIALNAYETGNISAIDFQPENTSYSSIENIGQTDLEMTGTITEKTVVRGGSWSGDDIVGIFQARLNRTSDMFGPIYGFRCTSSLEVASY